MDLIAAGESRLRHLKAFVLLVAESAIQERPQVLSHATLDGIILSSLRKEDPVELATHFLHRIATDHPLVDGNKRTALLCAVLVPRISIEAEAVVLPTGFAWHLTTPFRRYMEGTDKELVQFMLDLAEYRRSFADTRRFVLAHLSPSAQDKVE